MPDCQNTVFMAKSFTKNFRGFPKYKHVYTFVHNFMAMALRDQGHKNYSKTF